MNWLTLLRLLIRLIRYFYKMVILAADVYKCVKPMSYWNNLGVKQSTPWPLLGDTLGAIFQKKSDCEFTEWIYNMHPNSRYIGFYESTQPILCIKDTELTKQLTIKDFDYFTDRRSSIDPETNPLWGGNLATLKGQRWREMRATLSGSFTSSKMKNMFHLMEEAAENFAKFFLDKNQDIIEVEMKDTYTRYTNDVIATTAFGIKCDSLAEPNNPFYSMGKAVTNFKGISFMFRFLGYFFIPKVFKILRIPFYDRSITSYFQNIINETIRRREEEEIVRPDMINLLLEARKGIKHEENEAVETGFATVKESTDIGKFKQIKNLTNDDIMAQALAFFFAGFDIISTALCFGSYELAINEKVQDKLRTEIKETQKKANGKLTYDVLLKMKYMDMVVSEILRKWPPAVAVDRVCTKPYYIINPVTADEKPLALNVGDVLFFPIQGIHRDPDNFPNPENFDPERFSDENKDSIKPYTYLPFGIGPRNCIGSRFALLEVKALLFHLLLNFEIVRTKKTQVPLILDRKSLQHTVVGGFWFGLKRVST